MGIREGWAVGEKAGLVKEARLQGKGVGKGGKVVGLKVKVQAQWRRLGCRGRGRERGKGGGIEGEGAGPVDEAGLQGKGWGKGKRWWD